MLVALFKTLLKSCISVSRKPCVVIPTKVRLFTVICFVFDTSISPITPVALTEYCLRRIISTLSPIFKPDLSVSDFNVKDVPFISSISKVDDVL